MTACRSCGASIFFTRSATTGNPMPMDADPIPSGDYIIEDGRAVYVGTGLTLDYGNDRFISHFATCPNAPMHRKR